MGWDYKSGRTAKYKTNRKKYINALLPPDFNNASEPLYSTRCSECAGGRGLWDL